VSKAEKAKKELPTPTPEEIRKAKELTEDRLSFLIWRVLFPASPSLANFYAKYSLIWNMWIVLIIARISEGLIVSGFRTFGIPFIPELLGFFAFAMIAFILCKAWVFGGRKVGNERSG